MAIWKYILENLSDDNEVILLFVVDSKGSSPGKPGFKMAVTSNNQLFGSIGGGSAEFSAVEMAKAFVKKDDQHPFIHRQVHSEDGGEESSGMICAGEQLIAFVPMDQSYIPLIREIIDNINRGIKGLLKVSPLGIFYQSGKTIQSTTKSSIINERDWLYEEQIGRTYTLYIFGGGHVSLELSRLMQMLDFRIVIYDNRKELSTLLQNTFAHHKEIIDYKNASHYIEEGANSYVAIMTFGHRHDLLILRQIVKKELGYLGLMGSKSKVKSIQDILRKEGVSEKRLVTIDMPIGIPIKSNTPAEIAVSIAAKIIDVKNS